MSERFLGEGRKRELLIDALRRTRPLDGARSRLGHANLRGEPDRLGAFHFAAEVWDVEGHGGRVTPLGPQASTRSRARRGLLLALVVIEIVDFARDPHAWMSRFIERIEPRSLP